MIIWECISGQKQFMEISIAHSKDWTITNHNHHIEESLIQADLEVGRGLVVDTSIVADLLVVVNRIRLLHAIHTFMP